MLVFQMRFVKRQDTGRLVSIEIVADENGTAYTNTVKRGWAMDAAIEWPSINPASHLRRCDTSDQVQVSANVRGEEPPRVVRTAGLPHVFCVVNGRRRHVPYAEWWDDEGWPVRPNFEIIEMDDLLRIPLGPPCPITAPLNGQPMDQIMRDPHLMRTYLGSLVNGKGIELGAGATPLPIPLQADVIYVDAFRYGSQESRSFPGTTDFSRHVQVDVADKIESLETFSDESQDFVIASHVIEHTPNPIGALAAANRLLRRGGKLVLIVPDKRRTFDSPRETTPVTHMILDHEDYRRDRDLIHYAEWYSRVVGGSAQMALADWEIGADIHYHCFTPESFMELITSSMKYARWSRIDFIFPPDHQVPEPIEFYAILGK